MPVRAALVIGFVVVLAGCGGGNSRENFVGDAEAICTETNTRVKALGTPQSFTDTQLYARQAKDAVADELGDLRELTPPPELEDDFTRYLATLQERRAVLDRMADAADANSMKEIQRVGSDLDTVNAKAKIQARVAGIAGCEPG